MWYIRIIICIFNNKLQKVSFKKSYIWKNVATPILRECEDEDSHSQNGDFGVHRDS
jgi:hypothetical protein